MGTPRGLELSNVQCDEVWAHRAVWWRWVGAVSVCPPASPCRGASIVHSTRTMRVFFVWKRRCPPASPCRGASIVQSPRIMRVFFGMETPLRGRSGGHIGTAPTVSFGWITYGRLVSFGQIVDGG